MTEHSEQRFADSDVIPMFPTLVWKLQLSAARYTTMNADLLSAVAVLDGRPPVLEPHQAWQSAQDLHCRAAFRELVVSIDRAASATLRQMQVRDRPLEITACWVNILAPGAGHAMHHHPNNFLSGVYYLRTAPGADTINFHDPRNQTGIIRPPVVALTAENTDQVVVRVGEGMLLLFPSYLQHSVDTNRSELERVSISFNLMFSEFTACISKPLW